MNLISKLKKAAAADTAATTTVTAAPTAPTSPLDDVRNLDAIAAMLQKLQAHNERYDKAIAALIAAQRIVKGWDKPEPDLTWSVKRDVLAALGDAEGLAAFDREHAADVAREQDARQAISQQVLEAPARIKALEQHIKSIAAEMKAGVDETFLHDEAIRMFTPSARRMFDAAKLFVQAWREMLAMESALTHAIRLRHYSVFGDRLRSFDVELIGRTNPGDLLPNLIEGISYDELSDLNHAFRKYDEATSQQVNQRLQAAGIPNGWHTVYHPGANDDTRPIYAPDPNPPSKRPEAIPFAGATVVRIDN
mgnify:CR=1 FL=1